MESTKLSAMFAVSASAGGAARATTNHTRRRRVAMFPSIITSVCTRYGQHTCCDGSFIITVLKCRITVAKFCLKRDEIAESWGIPKWMLLRTSPIRRLSDSILIIVTDGSEMIRCEGRRDFSMAMIDGGESSARVTSQGLAKL